MELYTLTNCCHSLVPAAGGELRVVQLMFNATYTMILEEKKKSYDAVVVEMVFKCSTGTRRNYPPHSASSPR